MKNVNFKVLFALCLLGNLGFLWAIYEVQNEKLLYLKEVSKSLYERIDHQSEKNSSDRLFWNVKKHEKDSVELRKYHFIEEGWEPFAVDDDYVWYRWGSLHKGNL